MCQGKTWPHSISSFSLHFAHVNLLSLHDILTLCHSGQEKAHKFQRVFRLPNMCFIKKSHGWQGENPCFRVLGISPCLAFLGLFNTSGWRVSLSRFLDTGNKIGYDFTKALSDGDRKLPFRVPSG